MIAGTSRFVEAGLPDTRASGVAGPGPWSPALAPVACEITPRAGAGARVSCLGRAGPFPPSHPGGLGYK